ncbi:MAG: hypothetical protein JNK82_27700 [Myxococcaceae bacterium]|nr:hypothetical protein [Myxococcaceae bacterium]
MVVLGLSIGHGHHHDGGRHRAGTVVLPSWGLDDDGEPWVPVAELQREAVLAEISLLEGRRPGLGGPISLLVMGLLVGVTGIGFGLGGAVDTAITGVLSWALWVGGGVLVAGVVLFIVGLVVLGRVMEHRARIDWRLDRLEERLATLDETTTVLAPSGGGQLLTVARF